MSVSTHQLREYVARRAEHNGLTKLETAVAQDAAERLLAAGESVERIVATVAGEYRRLAA